MDLKNREAQEPNILTYTQVIFDENTKNTQYRKESLIWSGRMK